MRGKCKGSLAVEATVAVTFLILLTAAIILLFRFITLNSVVRYASLQASQETDVVVLHLAGIGVMETYMRDGSRGETAITPLKDGVTDLLFSFQKSAATKRYIFSPEDVRLSPGSLENALTRYSYSPERTAVAASFAACRMSLDQNLYDYTRTEQLYRAAWQKYVERRGQPDNTAMEELIAGIFEEKFRQNLFAYLRTEISPLVLSEEDIIVENWKFTLEGHVLVHECDIRYTPRIPLPLINASVGTIRRHVVGAVNLIPD